MATPGRLWELMSSSIDAHVYLDDLSDLRYTTRATSLMRFRFLVIDETDRMIERGHFQDLEHILSALDQRTETDNDNEPTVKKRNRQTFVFSATMTLSVEGRRTLGKRMRKEKKSKKGNYSSMPRTHTLSCSKRYRQIAWDGRLQAAGGSYRSIILEGDGYQADRDESTVPNRREGKILLSFLITLQDVYLYYFLKKYIGRTIVFVNSITCIRRLLPIFQLLKIENVWPMHAQMQQKQRLKNLERHVGRILTISPLQIQSFQNRRIDCNWCNISWCGHPRRWACCSLSNSEKLWSMAFYDI